ncbi:MULTISPECIES: PTS lactose/cellobiose transporter subunit IIA [Lactobacillaceae]|uniref:PTS lactose/cellobiose transporter subunit IIA n=1 Tax=Lactobacillaceae TaxID=33958 RepID=UPI00145681FC|nr:PTS lactose/cellobiose transporter subunit IIA [Lactobacillus sp. HBUAS51381]NLR10676.1 PTS lactose/cellobiose transporter subunit IIA [Lactobacillus sp. HBUAS51381]
MTPTIAQLAMQVLVQAGNAKNSLYQAITTARTQHQSLDLTTCQDQLLAAHKVQTQMMAKMAAEDLPVTTLINHAMDTLMAVQGNYELIVALGCDWQDK